MAYSVLQVWGGGLVQHMGRQKYKVGEGDGEIARINRARLVSGGGEEAVAG